MFRKITKELEKAIILLLSLVFLCNNNSIYALEMTTKKCDIDCNKYYYEQLSELSKKIYNNFEKSKKKFWNNEEIVYKIDNVNSEKTFNKKYYNEVGTLAKQAYILDNPIANIWFYQSEFIIYADINGDIMMSLKPKKATGQYGQIGSKELPKAIETLEEAANEFVKTLQGTDDEKLMQIHEWVRKNAVYDYTNSSNRYSAYGAIIDGRAVCSGLSYAYKYIADLAGLKVLYVTGTVNNELHAWNIAHFNGEWRLIDITYNQVPAGKKMPYLFTKVNDGYHIPDARFKYPND